MPKQLKPKDLSSAKFKTLEIFKNSTPESHRSYYNNLKSMINDYLNDWEIEIEPHKRTTGHIEIHDF